MSHSNTINHDQTEANPKYVAATVAITSVVIISTLVFGFFFYRSTLSAELTKKENSNLPLLSKQHKIYEQEQVNTLKWINKSQNKIQIPVKLAMEHVVKKYQK